MESILITGGAGFIGSHLSEALLAQGHRVTVLDDLSSGSEENIGHLTVEPGFTFIRGSISDTNLITSLTEPATVVFHLAATVGVFNILQRPVATLENNVGGTESVLRACVPGQKRVIVASTSEVYGKSSASPFREDGDLVLGASTKLRWGYAASKLLDEFLALAYWREYGVPATIVRLFNTIGPRQTGRYGMVVPRFLLQAMTGRDITVFGTGKQARSFTYVGDVVQWLLRLAFDQRSVGEVYNLGNMVEVTIEDLARRVIEVVGSGVGVQYVPYEVAYEDGFEDMERRVPDISKIQKLTGYAPQVDLHEALALTYEWFAGKLAAPDDRVVTAAMPGA